MTHPKRKKRHPTTEAEQGKFMTGGGMTADRSRVPGWIFRQKFGRPRSPMPQG
jgi:hypothetical protein